MKTLAEFPALVGGGSAALTIGAVDPHLTPNDAATLVVIDQHELDD